MRTTLDRIRHTLLFEGVALVLATGAATLVLENSATTIGTLAVTMSLIAMGWNYLYNLWFDRWLQIAPSQRSFKIRALHALGFEGGLLVATLPLVAWWLDMTLWHAFLTDIAFTLFFLIYAFAFNWAYDQIFPAQAELKPARLAD